MNTKNIKAYADSYPVHQEEHHQKKIHLYDRKLSSRSLSNRKKALFRILTMNMDFLESYSKHSENLHIVGNYLFIVSKHTKEHLTNFWIFSSEKSLDYDQETHHCGFFSIKQSQEDRKVQFIPCSFWRKLEQNESFSELEDPDEYIHWRKIQFVPNATKKFFFKKKRRKIKMNISKKKGGNFTSIEKLDSVEKRKINSKSRFRISSNKRRNARKTSHKQLSLEVKKRGRNILKLLDNGKREKPKKKVQPMFAFNKSQLYNGKSEMIVQKRNGRRNFKISRSSERKIKRFSDFSKSVCVNRFDQAVELFHKRRDKEVRAEWERCLALKVKEFQNLHRLC